ncbi:dermonecrotic toxin domain-containing protein, partial [Colwellia ponticola]|uniref:dermonecrotic toxin domain-containing protein n=1 Tax=Colwellia ponticola TaxID=2304625 RepID=UPI0014869376
EDIQRFTVAALQREMGRETAVGNGPDQIPTQGLNPDDVQLTFVVAAGYPGGAGIVEHVRMSLTELAIRNLSGRPSGEFTLTHRQGTPLPAWLTPAYVIALVERVDIGQHYPHYLKDQLLSDTAKARAQETLFAEHLSVQLPLL